MITALGFCLLSGCGKGSGRSTEVDALNTAASSAPPVSQASLPAPLNTADIDNGHAKFALCQACHTILPGAPNMTGPNLNGVFGRKAGSVASYSYSDAMKGASWTWDASHLDAWLSGPQKMLPGTKMTFVGLSDPKDRIDVIAYLATANGS
jgi:cytochrome c